MLQNRGIKILFIVSIVIIGIFVFTLIIFTTHSIYCGIVGDSSGYLPSIPVSEVKGLSALTIEKKLVNMYYSHISGGGTCFTYSVTFDNTGIIYFTEDDVPLIDDPLTVTVVKQGDKYTITHAPGSG